MPQDDPDPPLSPPPLPVGRATFRSVPWRWSDVIVGLLPLLALRIAFGLLTPADWAALPGLAWSVLMVLALAWMLGFPPWAARRRGARVPRWPRARSVVLEGALAIPLLLGIWFGLGFVIVAWELASGGPVHPPNPLEGPARSADPARVALLTVLVALAGPVAEETLFRGLIYNALRTRLPVVPAAVLQGLAFGFLHTYGLVHAVLASVLGVVIALVYEWRKTLVAPIFLHVFQNAAALGVALAAGSAPVLGVNGEPADGGVRVTVVAPGTGAAAAGLREGDVIVTVDHEPVADVRDIGRVVRRRRAGDTVEVTYVRDGERVQVEVEVVLRRRE